MLGAPAAGRRGFTMVESLLVVGIVSILAMVATHGVRRYLAMATSAEAIQSVGAIGRAAVQAGDRMAEGDTGATVTGQGRQGKGATVTHGVGLCGDATAVPKSFAAVTNRKYQPDTSPGKDYDAGTATTGWKCLGFEITTPQAYQYQYKLGGPPISVSLPHGGSPPGLSSSQRWSAYARGDLDGDGKISWFFIEGYQRNGHMVTSTGITIQDQDE